MNQKFSRGDNNMPCFYTTFIRTGRSAVRVEGCKYALTLEGAAHFADLPLRCMQREFPYKTGIAFPDSSLAVKPKDYHPAFYGCYDWHSSVHGHWMLVRLLKLFPAMPRAGEIRSKLKRICQRKNIRAEMKIFSMKDNTSFELPTAGPGCCNCTANY